jgi:dephospho-CoA kinase
MIICLIGRPGSGKTAAADILRSMGFATVEMSDGIREHMRKSGISITSDSIGKFAGASRKRHGKDIVARWAMPSIRKAPDDVVVSGVWSVEELMYLEKSLKGSLHIIFMDSPKRLRFSRELAREAKEKGKRENTTDYAMFNRKEQEQESRGIRKAIRESEFRIRNTGSMAQLKGDIKKTVAKIKALEKA